MTDRRTAAGRAAGLVLGFVADRMFGDPARLHPVAGFGTVATALERKIWNDSRPSGFAYTAILVGGAAAAGAVLERTTRGHLILHAATTGLVTWAVTGGHSLEREALAVAERLLDSDVPGAQERVGRIVGRDTSGLDETGVARATIETVAENTSDAVIAPLTWGAMAGIPGLMAYRAANTLDAMVGHRNTRYRHFGWSAARFDDVMNLAGARLSGTLTILAAGMIGGRPGDAVRAWHRDSGAHPSPNAGIVEATFAGALDVRLGGQTVYRGRIEHRPILGDGRCPDAHDIGRATQLGTIVGYLAVATVASAVAARTAVFSDASRARRQRRRRSSPPIRRRASRACER